MSESEEVVNKADNVLVAIPPTLSAPTNSEDSESIESRVKEYLSDARYRIALDDFVTEKIRETLYKLGDTNFPLQTSSVTAENFIERLQHYEQCCVDLRKVVALICKWGNVDQRHILQNIYIAAERSIPRSMKNPISSETIRRSSRGSSRACWDRGG